MLLPIILGFFLVIFLLGALKGLFTITISHGPKSPTGKKEEERMKKCPVCKKVNPDSAIICDCEYNFLEHRQMDSGIKTTYSAGETIKGLFGLAIILVVLYALYSTYFNWVTKDIPKPKPAKTENQGIPYTSKRRIAKECFGCRDRGYYSKLLEYARDGDRDAFNRALAAGVVSGQCTTFNAGEEVFRTDTAIFSGLLKIRRKGEVAEYWTNMEHISK